MSIHPDPALKNVMAVTCQAAGAAAAQVSDWIVAHRSLLVLTAVHWCATHIVGCSFVTVPRCADLPIPHGKVIGDWRGLRVRVECEKGYEYAGEDMECYDYDHCSLKAFANKRCGSTMVYLPVSAKSKHPTLKPNASTMGAGRSGKGGGSSMATQATTSWSLQDLNDWVTKVNCTPAKHPDDGLAVEEKFDSKLRSDYKAADAPHPHPMDSTFKSVCILGIAALLLAISFGRQSIIPRAPAGAEGDTDSDVPLE